VLAGSAGRGEVGAAAGFANGARQGMAPSWGGRSGGEEQQRKVREGGE
jgi:hypothetical protein